LEHGYEYIAKIDQLRAPTSDMWRPWSRNGCLNPYTEQRILEDLSQHDVRYRFRTLQPAIWKAVRYYSPPHMLRDHDVEHIAVQVAQAVLNHVKIDPGDTDLKAYMLGELSYVTEPETEGADLSLDTVSDGEEDAKPKKAKKTKKSKKSKK
jgi:hypothetical protein